MNAQVKFLTHPIAWAVASKRLMGNVVPFKRPPNKSNLAAKNKGMTLCLNGFHKWSIEKDTRFDVKQGKLITARRCRRCGKKSVEKT